MAIFIENSEVAVFEQLANLVLVALGRLILLASGASDGRRARTSLRLSEQFLHLTGREFSGRRVEVAVQLVIAVARWFDADSRRQMLAVSGDDVVRVVHGHAVRRVVQQKKKSGKSFVVMWWWWW